MVYLRKLKSEVFFLKYFIIHYVQYEKFLLMRKYYDFTREINCTCKLTCVCACACACDRMHLREQYESCIKSYDFVYLTAIIVCVAPSLLPIEGKRSQYLKS